MAISWVLWRALTPGGFWFQYGAACCEERSSKCLHETWHPYRKPLQKGAAGVWQRAVLVHSTSLGGPWGSSWHPLFVLLWCSAVWAPRSRNPACTSCHQERCPEQGAEIRTSFLNAFTSSCVRRHTSKGSSGSWWFCSTSRAFLEKPDYNAAYVFPLEQWVPMFPA